MAGLNIYGTGVGATRRRQTAIGTTDARRPSRFLAIRHPGDEIRDRGWQAMTAKKATNGGFEAVTPPGDDYG